MTRQPDLIDLHTRPDAMHLFHGHSLLISAQDGVVRGSGNQGLYHHNTRILGTWKHFINGEEPAFVSASAVDAYSMLAYYLAPDVKQQIPGLKPEENGLVLQVERFVGNGMHEDVTVRNYTQTPVDVELAWECTADFADLAEASEGRRRQQADISSEWRC